MRIKKVKDAVGITGTVVDTLDISGKNYVPNVDAVNSIKGEILWTNPNPTKAFEPQNITLSSDDYDVLEIFYADFTGSNRMMSTKLKKGYASNLQSVFQHNDSGYIGCRTINYGNDTTINFTANVTVVESQAFSRRAANDWNIPIYIVGYKTGLFD